MLTHDKARAKDVERGRALAPQGRPAPLQGILALQATAGNAAVVQMLRQAGHPWVQEQHEHTAGCGHQQAEPPTLQRSAVHDVLHTAGRPLDDNTRAEMEDRLGADFSDVRIHDDSSARASAAEVGARAYTSGNHVVMGESGENKHTLAHELTHVIQQRQGPVAGTDNGNGLKISDPSDRFEREAEANAARVMSSARRPAGEPEALQRSATSPSAEVVIQRCYYCDNNNCVDGATCGRATDHQGLFSPGVGRSAVAPYNQSRRQPIGGGNEREHMFPGAALRGAGRGNLYPTGPTYPVDIATHRAGVRGGVGGNGITSTGSGRVARDWSASLAAQVRAGNQVEAIRRVMVDSYNAAAMQGTLTEERVRDIGNTVYGHVSQGLITRAEADNLFNQLMDRWYGGSR